MCNLACVVQCHVLIDDKIMAPPNLSDKNVTTKPPKLLDQVRDKLQVKHYSIRTDDCQLIVRVVAGTTPATHKNRTARNPATLQYAVTGRAA